MIALASDAERMDRHYRYQRYIYDSTRTHYLIGRKHLIKRLAPAAGQSILEIGCGTAWNLVRLAKAYPLTHIYGVDVSSAMLKTAAHSLSRYGLTDRVTLKQGDATNFAPDALFGTQSFDRVIFSYALSMIPHWREALGHAATMLASSGQLHIVDFGQCDHLPRSFKRGFFAFLKHYTVVPRVEMEAVVREIAAQNGLVYTMTRLHRGYTDYALLTRPAVASAEVPSIQNTRAPQYPRD